MLDNRALQIFYSTQGAFDTRPVDMLYTVEQFTEVSQGSTAGFLDEWRLRKLLSGDAVAEAHNGGPCPFCVLGKG